MATQSYFADADNKIKRITKSYSNAAQHQISMSNNVTKINIIDNNPSYHPSDYKSISFGENVIDILPACCKDCTNVIAVSFGSKVKTIGNWAFYRNSSLLNAKFPSSLVSIGESAFYECSSMKSISFDTSKRVSIGLNAFYGCGIENLNVNTEDTFGDSAFRANSNLKSAKILGCKSLPNDCFNGCANLESVDLPASLTTLKARCFNGCTALKTIDLKKTSSLTSIGDDCFNGTQITQLKFSSSFNPLENFSQNALRGSNVQEIYLELDNSFFDENNETFEDFGAGHVISFFSKTGKKYVLNDNLIGLHTDKKVYVVSASIQKTNLKGMTIDSLRLRDMIKKQYGSEFDSHVVYNYLTDGVPKDRSSELPQITYPAPSLLINAIRTAKAKNPDLFIFHFSDHGGGAPTQGYSWNPDIHDETNGLTDWMCLCKTSDYPNDIDPDSGEPWPDKVSGENGYYRFKYERLYKELVSNKTDGQFKKIFLIFCCCHPSRKFILPTDAKNNPQVLVWTASKTFSASIMEYYVGHNLISLMLECTGKDISYENAWKKAQTNPNKLYKYSFPYTVDGETYTAICTTYKSNYNNFDEGLPMFT